MRETSVSMVCPACDTNWTAWPDELPEPGARFTCPNCEDERALSSFARTERDLTAIEELAG